MVLILAVPSSMVSYNAGLENSDQIILSFTDRSNTICGVENPVIDLETLQNIESFKHCRDSFHAKQYILVRIEIAGKMAISNMFSDTYTKKAYCMAKGHKFPNDFK